MKITILRGSKNTGNGEFDYYLNVFFDRWTKTTGEKWAGFRSIYSYANHRDVNNPDPQYQVRQWEKILESDPTEKTFDKLLKGFIK